METHSKLRAFQIYFYANLDPRDVWKCAQFVNGVAFLRSAFNGCITFPRLTAYPPPPPPPPAGGARTRIQQPPSEPFPHCFALLFFVNGDPQWATRAIGQFLVVYFARALPW